MSQMRPAANTKSNDSELANAKREPWQALSHLLSADRTSARVAASSRKRALEHGCEILAGSNELNARSVLDALLARERLGSTALGEGVAIPHCRLEECKTPVGVLLTLDKGVDYNAPDDQDVDLLFILVVPDNAADEHLQVLSQLANILVKDANRTVLRQANDSLTLFETMLSFDQSFEKDHQTSPPADGDNSAS